MARSRIEPDNFFVVREKPKDLVLDGRTFILVKSDPLKNYHGH